MVLVKISKTSDLSETKTRLGKKEFESEMRPALALRLVSSLKYSLQRVL